MKTWVIHVRDLDLQSEMKEHPFKECTRTRLSLFSLKVMMIKLGNHIKSHLKMSQICREKEEEWKIEGKCGGNGEKNKKNAKKT